MEQPDNRFYVYVYLDQMKPGNYNYGEYHFDYNPFYVGKGNGDRSNIHLTVDNNNKHFDNTIKKIQRVCNTDPIIVKYQEMLLEQDSLSLEIKMIATIGRHDLKKGPLCNLTDGGEGLSNPSAETRKKLGGMRGKKHTIESKQKMRKPKSEKAKINIALAQIGKKHSPEQNLKHSIMMSGDKHPFYGKYHTEESKKAMSEKLSGRKNGPCSDETKRRISAGNKGNVHVAWNKGKRWSDDVRQKMSESAKNRKSKVLK